MPVRDIRGAINVSANTHDAIKEAATRLLTAMCEANQVEAVAGAPRQPSVGRLERQLAAWHRRMRTAGSGNR